MKGWGKDLRRLTKATDQETGEFLKFQFHFGNLPGNSRLQIPRINVEKEHLGSTLVYKTQEGHLCKRLAGTHPPRTFQQRAAFPDGDGPCRTILAEAELHQEEGEAGEEKHDGVRDQEHSWERETIAVRQPAFHHWSYQRILQSCSF